MRVDPGGARGPRPTWRQRIMRMGGQSRPPLRSGMSRGGGSYRAGRRGRRPLQSGTSRTPSPTERDVEDAVPYGRYIAQDRRGRCPHRPAGNAQSAAGHAGPALHGDSTLCGWVDRVVRPDGVGCRGRRLLQSGTSRAAAPTERDVEDAVPYREGRGVPRWVRRAGGKR